MDITAPKEVIDTAAWADAHANDDAPEVTEQYLTFSAAKTMYAMSIASTREIIEYGQVTRIPLMPPFIRGVINLRGSVVPVIDLAARLGFDPSRPGRRTCIVVVEMPHDDEVFNLGMVVDGVNEVLELCSVDLEPPPRFGANIRADFIQALAKIRGQFVVVMHLDQVLSIKEVAALARLGESSDLGKPKHQDVDQKVSQP